MEYPKEITIIRDSPEYNILYDHSKLLRTIFDRYMKDDEIILSPTLFGGDDDEWCMFIDVFFPEMGIGKIFIFKNKSIQVNPERGTREDLMNLLDYLEVDEDKRRNFARAQAKKQINAPLNTAPPGKGQGRYTRKINIKKYINKYIKKYKNNKNNNNNNSEEILGFLNKE